MERRRLGTTDIFVSPVALGCWPIAGITSLGTNEADSLATIRSCFDVGVNFLDTAYAYGYEGESERLIASALGPRRDEMVLATKGGIHWGPDRKQVLDGSPATLRRQCEESLRRLQTDHVELYYLHAPDPKVPVAESAAALGGLLEAGKTRSVGVSNMTVEQLEEFSAVCPITACQPPYNMLQREIEADVLPWCRERNVSLATYWPLMKGLLSGKLARDQKLPAGDARHKYPMFQGDEWEKNQDFLDRLREIAAEIGRSVAQVVVNWTIHRPGITVALCGAKRPEQIRETAEAMDWRLTPAQLVRIERAIQQRGKPVTRAAV